MRNLHKTDISCCSSTFLSQFSMLHVAFAFAAFTCFAIAVLRSGLLLPTFAKSMKKKKAGFHKSTYSVYKNIMNLIIY